jgi:hypothetical protein
MLGVGPITANAIAVNTPIGAVSVSASFTLTAPAAVLTGAAFAPLFLVTPRPPVSTKEATRTSTDDIDTGDWATILQVPQYIIPPIPGTPGRVVSATYVVSRATAVAVDGSPAEVEFRVVDLIGERVVPLLSAMPVDETDFTDLPFTGGMFGAQELLQVRSLTGDEVHVTVSYVNRTEEVYDVVV